MSYTKGPWFWDGRVWEYDPSQEAPWLLGGDKNRVLSGSIICPIEANARLIAAAPELLEALKWYVREDDVNEDMDGNAFWIEGKRKAESAIKKAEGKA